MTVRSRRVSADAVVLDALVAALDVGAPAVLRLNLFPGLVAESAVEWSGLTSTGYAFAGGVAGDPVGSAALVVNGDLLRGVVRTGGGEYELRGAVGAVTIRELARAPVPIDASAEVSGGPAPLPDALDLEAQFFPDSGDRVDVAFFYTRAAEDYAGGRDGIHALLDLWVADTNAAYRRSGIRHELAVVHRSRSPWTRPFDELTAVADEYRADLIYRVPAWRDIEDEDDNDFCGYAGGRSGVSRVESFCGSRTFAHEVGHNHGMSHDRYSHGSGCTAAVCYSTGASPWYPVYAYGYVNQYGFHSAGGWAAWETIMAYPDQCGAAGIDCARPMRFSNPRQRFWGDRLGVFGETDLQPYDSPEDAARRGPADAARTHNDLAVRVANYAPRGKPDLVVRGARFADSFAVVGGVAEIDAVVLNLGVDAAPHDSLEAFAQEWSGGWRKVGPSVYLDAVPFPAGGRQRVRLPIDVTAARLNRRFRVGVSGAAGETLLANNWSDGFVLAAYPEVAVGLDLEGTEPAVVFGETIHGTLTARNFSSGRSPLSSITVWEYSTRDEVLSDEVFNVPSLSAGTTRTVGYSAYMDYGHRGRWFTACIYPRGAEPPPPLPRDRSADAVCSPLFWVTAVHALSSRISGPGSALQGSPFEIEVSAVNVSSTVNTPAGEFLLQAYASEPEPAWITLDRGPLPPTNPGERTSYRFHLDGFYDGVPLEAREWLLVGGVCPSPGRGWEHGCEWGYHDIHITAP